MGTTPSSKIELCLPLKSIAAHTQHKSDHRLHLDIDYRLALGLAPWLALAARLCGSDGLLKQRRSVAVALAVLDQLRRRGKYRQMEAKCGEPAQLRSTRTANVQAHAGQV